MAKFNYNIKAMKNKLLTKEQVREKFFNNPIMETLKKLYPDRDYELQFELMMDWYDSQKGRMPQTIAAFSNWLVKTKADEGLRGERLRKMGAEETKQKLREMSGTPVASPEKLRAMREQMSHIGNISTKPMTKIFTSQEEINEKLTVAVAVLKTGEEVNITPNVYTKLHQNVKFRSKKGTVFSSEDVEKIIPIDDYEKK